MSPADWVADLLSVTGSQSDGRLWQCPAHPDPGPSLSVRQHDDGWASVHCFAGCSSRDVLRVLRLPQAALLRTPATRPEWHVAEQGLAIDYPAVEYRELARAPGARGWRLEAIHPYGAWRLLRWRHRSGQKSLSWESCRDGVWIPGLLGTPLEELPAYYAIDVAGAVALGEPVYVVESESSADAFARQGIVATTWAGGAAATHAPAIMARTLAGAHVVGVPDNDPPGRTCWHRIHRRLVDHTASVHVVWPDPGNDARDLLATDPDRIPR